MFSCVTLIQILFQVLFSLTIYKYQYIEISHFSTISLFACCIYIDCLLCMAYDFVLYRTHKRFAILLGSSLILCYYLYL